MKRLSKAFICILLALSALLASCGCQARREDGAGFLDLLDSPSTTLNNVWYNTGGIFRCAVFDSLVSADADMKTVKPALAEDYSVSEDGATYTFTLHSNAKWHDGEAVDAEDVVFSFKSILRSKEVNGILASAFQYIEGAEAYKEGSAENISGISVSENTVVIRLTLPIGNFLSAMAQFAILPEHILGNVAPHDLETHEYWNSPIGCGPYKITEAVPGEYFILNANEDYYGEKPGIGKIRLKVSMEDPVAAMQAGELDFYVTNDPVEIAKLQGAENCTSHRLNVLFPAYLIFNLSNDAGVNEDLKDVRVRKALLLAIDRKTIVDAVFPGSTVSDTMVPSWDSGYLNGGESYDFDPERAKALLEEADFDFSKAIRLRYFTKGQSTADLLNAIAVYWRAIGINVELQMFEGSGSEHMFRTRDYDICYKRLSAFDHAAIYEEMYGTGIMQTSIYNMPIYDDLLERLSLTLDETARLEIISEMQALDKEQILRLPLFALENVAYVNETRFEMPDAYGNIWYRYDLRFEDWRLTE